MRSPMPALSLLLALAAPGAAQTGDARTSHAHGESSYADHTDREIKALSADEVQGLLEGQGMEMALPAELNGFPGPLHVLELADSLALTPAQREATERIREAMLTEARRLGALVVDAERALDRAFAAGTLTASQLREATRELGLLRGELRAAHLAAHLEMKALLSQHQVHRYAELRGYGAAHGHDR